MLTRLALFVSAWLFVGATQAGYRLETVAEHLQTPWGLAFLPDGVFLVTEHAGNLRIVSADGEVGPPVAGVPSVYYKSQGGLFDVVLHPGFASNQMIYLTYAEGTPGDNGTAVARATLSRDGLKGELKDLEVIFRVARRKDTPVHYGGRLAFLPDGTMLLTTGDGFSYRDEAQSIHSQLGKTLRMTDAGKPALGNPFPEAPYVWTYGHRNPQGLTVTRDGTVWLNEHGPQGGDELNRIEPGRNYGWPAICYCLDYTNAYVTPFTEWEGMEQPLHYWRPSIAPSGLAVYEGDRFPEWQGDFFTGALVNKEIRRLHQLPDGTLEEEKLFGEVGERVRDVRSGPDGALYFTIEGTNGRIMRAVSDTPLPETAPTPESAPVDDAVTSSPPDVD